MKKKLAVIWGTLLLGVLPALAVAPGGIANSRHNLSASGPGKIKASTEAEICIFCHTPHNATTVQPLWNRAMPVSAYRPYTSNSLKAAPGQPTGSSKLCLSCHDGTIALGSVQSRSQRITMAAGITTMPPGAAYLGRNLSDDHPISFKYDTTLAQKNHKLKVPSGLPAALHLDRNQELQCSTCHDAHNNVFGKFLVTSNQNAELCVACHAMGTTDAAVHQLCNNCHQPHTSPSGPYLLVKAKVGDTCLTCHSGTGGANQGANIAADLAKSDPHYTASAVNLPDEIPHNVVCADCHESHTMQVTAGAAPNIRGVLGAIDGKSGTGATATPARYEYEVCFKCHGDQQAVPPVISRQIAQGNTRLKFAPTAASFHPVETAGKNSFVPSLKPGYTAQSLIYCTDCHSSDTSKKAGGSGPNGPHGSKYHPLLLANYITNDRTAESADAYALCYRCHDRQNLLSNASFPLHRKHIVDQRTPCSVCHDSHGVPTPGSAAKNFALINFDTSIVRPLGTPGKLEYNHPAPSRGKCYLQCHGKDHNGLGY